jgi:LmbE family N-acetylglucosaminyl deacetylase
MIQPIVKHAEWLDLLGGLRDWNPPRKSTLIIAPHPDDETLGAGGFIAAQCARGIDVIVAAVTDGEHAYADNAGLREARRLEQSSALAYLGVPPQKIFRLGLPDSSVETHEFELAQRIASLASANTLIVAPWRGDFHPDHRSCGRAAEQAALLTGASLASYFFWTWHMVEPEELAGMRLHAFPLSTRFANAKAAALQQHRSQLYREDGNPILPEELLGPSKWPFEVFALS